MDFSDFDSVKREKANAMMRYRRLRKIANLFRLFELLFAFIVFSWFSTQLPSLLGFTGKFFKKFCVVLVSPCFVFLIGNAIIITLFVKSGQFPTDSPSGNKEDNLYDEFLKNSENRQKIYTETSPVEEIVFQDKQTVCEATTTPPRDSPPHSPRTKHRDSPPITPRTKHRDSPPITPRSKQPELVLKGRSYRRSQSENIKREIDEKPKRELRRSETEKCRKVDNSVKGPARKSVGEKEEMSNEEFQRRIEAFIQKQAKFHLEESMAIVLQNHQSC